MTKDELDEANAITREIQSIDRAINLFEGLEPEFLPSVHKSIFKDVMAQSLAKYQEERAYLTRKLAAI